MIRMFTGVGASVGRVHDPARASCTAGSIGSRARRRAGVGRLAMAIAVLGCACTDDGVETSASAPVAHDPPQRETQRATGLEGPNRAEARPYGSAGLERVGARAATAATAVAGEARQPGCSLVVGLASKEAGVDPEAARTATIQEAVDQAEPGDVVCVFSAGPDRERVMVTRSGTPNAPIRIRAVGEIQSAGFVVEADHVSIEGFSITNRGVGDDEGRGMGIYLAGTGFEIRNNRVTDTDGDGIGCEHNPPRCTDVVIASNTVRGANGTGIIVLGRRILVENNDVAGSVMGNGIDADGIRFFGSDIIIRGNYIHDIYDRGYPPDEGPHTDCFQTFDDSKPPTVSVTIENNVCHDVDHQCLIAEAVTQQQSSGIIFRNNICRNNGSQALFIRQFPRVTVTNNLFLDSIVYNGIFLESGSTDVVIGNNVFVGEYRPYIADATSLPGLVADHNLVFDRDNPTPPAWWSEANGIWGVDPFGLHGGSSTTPYRPAMGSPLVDAGTNAYGGAGTDLDGGPRVGDGNHDGEAVIDIGPYEMAAGTEGGGS
jgi:nitrous oxidase accessory protein NosD